MQARSDENVIFEQLISDYRTFKLKLIYALANATPDPRRVQSEIDLIESELSEPYLHTTQRMM